MNKAVKISNQPHIYQYKTDGGECERLQVPIAGADHILVEVLGELTGDVVIYGGLLDADSPLETIRSAPSLVQIPAVRFVKPKAPADVTINIMGAM